MEGGISTNGKKDIIKFLMKFYMLFLIIFLIFEYFGDYLVGITAYLTYIFVKFIISNAILKGNIIYLSNSAVEIIKECTGGFLIAGFLALIIVYSKNIKEFFIGIIFVFLAYMTNILRIVLICYLLNIHPKNPLLLHDIVGYSVILVFVPTLVLIYLKIIKWLREGNNAIY